MASWSTLTKGASYARERVREATAVYFEWLAQKEKRDYEQRQRLSEVARFYRSLAGIIPALPTRRSDGFGSPVLKFH